MEDGGNARIIVSEKSGFTRRQKEVAQLIVDGYNNKKIAKEMGITISAVKKLIGGGNSASPNTRRGIMGTLEILTGKRPSRHGIPHALLKSGKAELTSGTKH